MPKRNLIISADVPVVLGDTWYGELPGTSVSRGAPRAELQKAVSNREEANASRANCTPCAQTQHGSSASRNTHRNIFVMTVEPPGARQSSQQGVKCSAQRQAAPNLLQGCHLPAPSGTAGASGFLQSVSVQLSLCEKRLRERKITIQGVFSEDEQATAAFSWGYCLQHTSPVVSDTGTQI